MWHQGGPIPEGKPARCGDLIAPNFVLGSARLARRCVRRLGHNSVFRFRVTGISATAGI